MIAAIRHEPLEPGILMTPTEVADALRISARHLSRLTAPHGDLECLRLAPRIVRYERAVVEQWIEGQRAKARHGSETAGEQTSDVGACSTLRMTNSASVADD